jgi:undecaprenyl-phosphate 4-deoxy-4-formamido-L-arabinose transferase
MSDIQISIVIPVYNEEANLNALMKRLMPVMKGLGKRFEIILIDDGSRDNSLEVLKEFAKEPSVKVVELTRNYGQHAAIMAGFSVCTG